TKENARSKPIYCMVNAGVNITTVDITTSRRNAIALSLLYLYMLSFIMLFRGDCSYFFYDIVHESCRGKKSDQHDYNL
ncbi:hypothetical protein, partial [Escherichia coli]|uniref:hypothetical protein n=2 Tax=Escherichia coli TaxID=562 RepID=UPI001BC865BB